jgi:hypothetical protein
VNLPDALFYAYPIEATWIARDIKRYTGLNVVSGKPGIPILAFFEENGAERQSMTRISCFGDICSGGDLYNVHEVTYTLRLEDAAGKWSIQKSVTMNKGERVNLIGGSYDTYTESHDEAAVRTLVKSVFHGIKASKRCR